MAVALLIIRPNYADIVRFLRIVLEVISKLLHNPICAIYLRFRNKTVSLSTHHYNMDKNQYERYKIIDRILRSIPEGLSLDDLIERLNGFLPTENHIKKRQLQYDLEAMSDLYSAPISRRKGFRRVRYWDAGYSIVSHELKTSLEDWKTMLQKEDNYDEETQSLKRFQNMVTILQDSFSSNPIAREAIDYGNYMDSYNSHRVHEFYSYIVNKKVLQVKYHVGRRTKTVIIHPYFVRQDNAFWFLYGWSEAAYQSGCPETGIMNIRLDLIAETYIDDEQTYRDISLEELKKLKRRYFSDFVGVTRPKEGECRLIVIRFDFRTGNKMKDDASRKAFYDFKENPLPIVSTFASDELIAENGYAEVRMSAILNTELEVALLKYADTAKILEPVELRDAMIKRIHAMVDKQGE